MRHPDTIPEMTPGASPEPAKPAVATSRRALLRGLGLASVGAAALAAGCSKNEASAAPTAQAAAPDTSGPALLNSNENPFGPSPMAKEAMAKAIAGCNRYANEPTMELQKKIAAIEGVDPEMVVISNGSSPILQAFGMWMGEDKGELVTSVATYENIPSSSAKYGAKVIEVPMAEDLKFDLNAMAAKMSSKTKAAYICNPNNPTGNMVDPTALKAFVEAAPKQAVTFIDEAYLDLCDDYDANVMTGLLRDGHNVIVCRTFSKIYGMAGQRVGYALMKKELAMPFWQTVRQGGINHIGVMGAMASLDDKAFYADQKARLKRGREKLIAMADAMKLSYAKDSQANFIFVDTGMPNKDFSAKMSAEGVKVGRSWKGYETWSRICVGEDWELDRCEAALKKVLSA